MKWWHNAIGFIAAVLWLFVIGPRVGPRPFLVFFGALCVAGSFSKHTRIGPAFSRGRGGHPATKPERILLCVGGAAFVAAGAFGWIH